MQQLMRTNAGKGGQWSSKQLSLFEIITRVHKFVCLYTFDVDMNWDYVNSPITKLWGFYN